MSTTSPLSFCILNYGTGINKALNLIEFLYKYQPNYKYFEGRLVLTLQLHVLYRQLRTKKEFYHCLRDFGETGTE